MLTCAGHCTDTKRYNLYPQEAKDTKWCLKIFLSISKEAIRNEVICIKRDFSLYCTQFTLKGELLALALVNHMIALIIKVTATLPSKWKMSRIVGKYAVHGSQ